MVVILSLVVWLLVIGYFALVATVLIHWNSHCGFGQGLFEGFRSFEGFRVFEGVLFVFIPVLVTGFLGIFN